MSPLLTLRQVRLAPNPPCGGSGAGINLEVGAGDRLAILGPEGCGKGHLLRIMAGLAKPTGGKVLWEGEPLAGCPARLRAGRVGVLFADVERQFLAPLVGEEIALGALAQGLAGEALESRIQHAMTLAALPPAWRATPLARLTPSQRSRVALAAVLVTRPRLLLAEEPGALLSLEGEEALAVILAQLVDHLGMACVVFTNREARAHRFAPIIHHLAAEGLQPGQGN